MFSIGMSSLAFLLFSCNGLSGNLISTPQEIPSGTESTTELPEEVSQQERIYQLAKASG